MTQEVVKLSPVVERLKDLFPDWSRVEGSLGPYDASIKLNDRESIRGELHSADAEDLSTRDLLRCSVVRDGDEIVEFSVGERGLEQIGFGGLELSFRGSPRIKIMEGLGIGPKGAYTTLHVNREEVREYGKFKELASILTTWVEDIKYKGEIGEIPLSLTHHA